MTLYAGIDEHRRIALKQQIAIDGLISGLSRRNPGQAPVNRHTTAQSEDPSWNKLHYLAQHQPPCREITTYGPGAHDASLLTVRASLEASLPVRHAGRT